MTLNNETTPWFPGWTPPFPRRTMCHSSLCEMKLRPERRAWRLTAWRPFWSPEEEEQHLHHSDTLDKEICVLLTLSIKSLSILSSTWTQAPIHWSDSKENFINSGRRMGLLRTHHWAGPSWTGPGGGSRAGAHEAAVVWRLGGERAESQFKLRHLSTRINFNQNNWITMLLNVRMIIQLVLTAELNEKISCSIDYY